MKFTDLVEFNIAQITYKARNNLLPGYTQKMFFDREGGYNLRGKYNFNKLCVRTTMMSMMHIYICGVNLWTGLNVELKQIANINQFKKIYI